MGFSGGASGKEPACNTGHVRDKGSVPGSRRSPGGGNDNLLHYSCLGNTMEERSLVGYSPWGCGVRHD